MVARVVLGPGGCATGDGVERNQQPHAQLQTAGVQGTVRQQIH